MFILIDFLGRRKRANWLEAFLLQIQVLWEYLKEYAK